MLDLEGGEKVTFLFPTQAAKRPTVTNFLQVARKKYT
jgi:hypothetical protein